MIDDVPPVVCFRSVVALVDQFPVLSGVDLDLDAGEIVLVEGPNGAGKTSLLRVMAGLLRPTAGQATVLGIDLFDSPKAARAHIGFLGHESFLYGDLTVQENVNFFVRAAGGNPGAIHRALSRLDLDGRLASVTVDRLSAGQRRRASLAVVVARDPQLWLLDEPHAGLDAASRYEFDAIVREAAARGRSILFSSHETELAAALANRRVEIRGGSVQTASTDVGLLNSNVSPVSINVG